MTSPAAPDAPHLPEIELELLEDLSPEASGGFLKLIRRRYRARYPDGSISEPFLYDQIDRRAIDAVVICAHYLDSQGPAVYLRSALRPPIFDRASRDQGGGGISIAKVPHGNLWELPAGLVEAREQGPDGPRRTAQRELHEELGFRVPLKALKPLGAPMYPAPGFLAEQHFYFQVLVDPAAQEEPPLDGSPLEHFGRVVAMTLDRALWMCERGQIQDAKTELGLRRLRECLG